MSYNNNNISTQTNFINVGQTSNNQVQQAYIHNNKIKNKKQKKTK